jgi:hypothetical protein
MGGHAESLKNSHLAPMRAAPQLAPAGAACQLPPADLNIIMKIIKPALHIALIRGKS